MSETETHPLAESKRGPSDAQAQAQGPAEAPSGYTGQAQTSPRGVPGGGSIGPEPRHLTDYVLTLYRHRWGAAAAFVVVFLAVALYTFTATPEYEGRAQIQIDPDPNIVAFKQVADLDKRSLEYYQTQLSILKSRALARRTIDNLNLWNSPELGSGPAQSSGLSSAAGARLTPWPAAPRPARLPTSPRRPPPMKPPPSRAPSTRCSTVSPSSRFRTRGWLKSACRRQARPPRPASPTRS